MRRVVMLKELKMMFLWLKMRLSDTKLVYIRLLAVYSYAKIDKVLLSKLSKSLLKASTWNASSMDQSLYTCAAATITWESCLRRRVRCLKLRAFTRRSSKYGKTSSLTRTLGQSRTITTQLSTAFIMKRRMNISKTYLWPLRLNMDLKTYWRLSASSLSAWYYSKMRIRKQLLIWWLKRTSFIATAWVNLIARLRK